MAINWIEDGALFASSPSWYRRVGYEEIGRDASTVTIRVHLHLKLKGNGSSTFYGYPAFWNVNDGGSMQIKNSSRWYGGQDYRGFSTDIRVGANAGGGTGNFKIHMWSTSGGNAGFTQNFSFNYSKWNTKPYWIGGNKITLRENNAGGRVICSEAWGAENAHKFAENIGAIYVDWEWQARDNENNPLTYELWMQSNEGGWSIIYSGNNTNFTHYIGEGAGTQGYTYDYYVKVRDSYGEWADGECNATQIQKNQLYQAMLNHNGNVNFDTTTINLSRTNASNTNGNGTFTYKLYSNDVTVYNGNKVNGNSIPVTIYKSGNVPNTPYIKWDDLKRFLAGSNYNRNLRFVLTTTNAYGSTSSDYEDIWCDIRKNPTGFSFNTVSGVTVVNGKSYFLPSEKPFTMTWGVATDPLGTQVTYDLYYAYDNVSWNLLASNLKNNTFTGKLPNVNKLTILTFRVVAKTTYGTTTATEGGRTELHYVGTPSVYMNLTRNQSNYVIDGRVTVNSSIPNIGLSLIRYRDNDSARFNEAPISGLTFKISRNLAETESEELVVYVLDRGNSDLGRQSTEQKISISRYMPMLSIREKGVGVNAIPDGSAKLVVNGGIRIDGIGSNSVRHFGKRLITVNGDKNTYYPVLLRGCMGFATNRISISRGYNWKAPDAWNTATHRGGLTLTFRWAGDGTWGGNSRVYTVEEFDETYTTMVAGMQNTTGGFVVWLRGGGADYQIDNDYGRLIETQIFLGDYVAPDKKVYSPRTSRNEVDSEIRRFYCVRSNQLFDEGRRVLTEGNLSTTGNIRNKVGYVTNDGVMEIGRYLDFHKGESGDYDTRIQVNDDNSIETKTTTVVPNLLAIKELGYDGNKAVQNTSQIGIRSGNNGLGIGLSPDFNSRNGWIQVGHGDDSFAQTYGSLRLNPKGGTVWIHNDLAMSARHNGEYYGLCVDTDDSNWIRTTQSGIIPYKGGVNSNIGTGAWAFNEGNFRYLCSPNSQNIDIVARNGIVYFDVQSQTGCGVLIDRLWGGTEGSEACIHTNKGNGWGFIGNSGNAFYRIYGTGGSISDRARKYDIHKFDPNYLYDQVKELNIYAYRTISDEVDEDGNKIRELKRSDMQLGCMIQELPFEVVLCDAEGGNGKAVDVYAYTTMILGATQVAQKKIDKLENEISTLKKELGVQNKTNLDLINRLETIERILQEHGIN